jgi:hypothetical protein
MCSIAVLEEKRCYVPLINCFIPEFLQDVMLRMDQFAASAYTRRGARCSEADV